MIAHLKKLAAANVLARYVARPLVMQYASSAVIRRMYASARAISTKTVYPISPKLHELLFVKLKLYLRKQSLIGGFSSVFSPAHLYCLPKQPCANFQPKVTVIVPSYNHAG